MASEDVAASFRAKITFMKSWKPASPPSNRDRLELYALHKQALSGDAPASLSTNSPAEKAKYQAWRSKNGITKEQAMSLYLQESDRQVRVYGSVPNQLDSAQNPQAPATSGGSSGAGGRPTENAPKGLAAIPLLCAAACESRPAYLRRMSQTPINQAWWKRQEALCATPGSLRALPEGLLLFSARTVEYISLAGQEPGSLPFFYIFPARLTQAFLWPIHNCFLSLWMGVILILTMVSAAWQSSQTIIWGARRTGISLSSIWNDKVLLCQQSITGMCQSNQALSTRLVGLGLLPFATCVGILNGLLGFQLALASLAFSWLITLTWWYWMMVCPWLSLCLLGTALFSGSCFALIELAGV